MLRHAIENEPDRMKPILKQAGLLSRRFKDDVRLPKRNIKHLVDEKLDAGIGAIEKVIIDRMTPAEIKKAYHVMETFLNLLAQIEEGVDQKLVNAYLSRKVEDEFFIKMMAERGMPAEELRDVLLNEPDDEELKGFFINKSVDIGIVDQLFAQRDTFRNNLHKLLIGETLSAEDVLASKENEFERLLSVQLKLDELLNHEDLNPELFITQFEASLETIQLPKTLALKLVELKKQQTPRIKEVMQLVSQRIEEQVKNDIKASTLVYIKSSVKAPKGKIVTDNETMYGAYKYKIYHPSFPHESTADQFFDPVQWEAYYMLGQYLGAEVLDVKGLEDFFNNRKIAPNFSIKDLLYRFDHDQNVKDLFVYRSEEVLPPTPVEMENEPGLEFIEKISTKMIVPADDPEEELLDEINPSKMKKKVVAGKNIDYTI